MTKHYIIGKAFESYTPETFHAYVTGLYRAPDTLPDSKSVTGIRLSWNKNGAMIVTCKLEEKELTEAQVAALAIEHKQDKTELTAALTKRKFKITNEQGEQVNAKPKRTRRGRATKPDAQRNAHLDQSGTAHDSQNQLFKS